MLSHKEVQESHCSRTICQFEERRARGEGSLGILPPPSLKISSIRRMLPRTENVEIAETADQFEEPISYADPFITFNRTFRYCFRMIYSRIAHDRSRILSSKELATKVFCYGYYLWK